MVNRARCLSRRGVGLRVEGTTETGRGYLTEISGINMMGEVMVCFGELEGLGQVFTTVLECDESGRGAILVMAATTMGRGCTTTL